MPIETAKLTVRLPKEDIAFAKQYAKANGTSVTEVIDRYLRRMRALDSTVPSPALDEITGLLPSDVDAQAELELRWHAKHR